MKFLLLYLLAGMIVAVWTAINQQRADRAMAEAQRLPFGDLVSAYLMIALAWPLSLAVFVMALVSHFRSSGESRN
jgi:ABC-type lipoprotein release transport system permease subunit